MAQAAIIYKCTLCETEDNVEYYCVNCEEILCRNCKLLHLKSRKTKNDEVVALTQALQDDLLNKSTTVYYHEHTSTEITLFCLKCDQLICTQCLAEKHSGHNITTLDKIKDSKTEKLKNIVKTLKEKKVVYENAFDHQGQAHSRFLKSIDQVEKDILEQKAKIIEELNAVCEEQLSETKKLRQNENKNYSDSCNKIQLQSQAVTSAIQTAENGIASNNTVLIVQATIDTTNTLDRLEDTTMPPTTIATYQPGDRSHPTISHIQGKVNLEQTTASHHPSDRNRTATPQVQTKEQEKEAKPKQNTDVHKVKFQEQKTIGDKKQHHDVNKPKIDKKKLQVKSTVQVPGKGYIDVIVPLKNNEAWVQCGLEDHLTQIDSTGRTITRSVSLGSFIEDAKLYRNGLLVTCNRGSEIYNLSSEGKLTLTFADLSPYNTTGLCVTHHMEVVVCLYRSSTDSKVVRLDTLGHVIQTLQHSTTGAPLYKQPWKVTSLIAGEVIVIDGSNKIVGVDRKGVHLFTWEGEIQGRQLDDHSLYSITHDSNDNLFVTDDVYNRVFVLGKDGSGAMCLLDRTYGRGGVSGIAIDNTGQLWVGCSSGNIHISKY